MAWIMDTFSMNKGYSVPSVVTGKPVSIGGSLGRGGATSRGVLYSALSAMEGLGMPIEGTRVAIQGFGKVGGFAAQVFHDAGFNIVGVSDYKGGVYNSRGLNPTALMRYKDEAQTVAGFPAADAITNEELIELDCDVLVPAAIEDQITGRNADLVRAKLIVEGANGPTTPEADHSLSERGVYIVPDVLANSGGVTVSYFEWVQDIQAYFWSEDQVNRQLRDVMASAFNAAASLAEEKNVRLRWASAGSQKPTSRAAFTPDPPSRKPLTAYGRMTRSAREETWNSLRPRCTSPSANARSSPSSAAGGSRAARRNARSAMHSTCRRLATTRS